jgi:phosphoserine phosphatase RsbU/P
MLPSSYTMQSRPFLSSVSSQNDTLNSDEDISTVNISTLQTLVDRLNREQNKIQNLLSSLGFALRSFNNLNQFLELTPLMAARVADADGGALILFKKDGQITLEQLHCQEGQSCRDIRQALEVVTRQLTSDNLQDFSLSEKTEKETQFSLFSASLDQQVQDYIGSQIQLFSTPILVKNIERGKLYIFSYDPQYTWTSTRRKLVQLVADQTAVAIANNELTLELRKKERQDRELEIASEIQLHLLPSKCPKIRGIELAASCRTANRVGGDYYDFIPANYDQNPNTQTEEQSDLPWSIVIGDVMGKGVPAGLIMTMARGMLRAEILNRHSPARILEHLNRVMYADLENSNRFLTLFYSEYNPKTHILSYSNAAHNPPLLWKAQTKKIELLDSWGMLVGLEADSNYEEAQVKLSVGDAIMYYTDGLTDAMNPQGDRFDENNLHRSFEWACNHLSSSKDIRDYLFDVVFQFVGKGKPHGDDMTLIILKVTE